MTTAAHLTDHVLPDLPLRHWVLAVPKRPRYLLERDADFQRAALHSFLRAVESCMRAHSAGYPSAVLIMFPSSGSRGGAGDFHPHRGQSIEEPRSAEDRPPVVEKDLERPPQRDPGAEHDALVQETAAGVPLHQLRHQVADEMRARDENETDEEGPAPGAEQLSQPRAGRGRAPGEAPPDRLPQRARFVGRGRLARHAHEERERRVAALLAGSFDVERLGLEIEVPLAKRLGVNRIEGLLEPIARGVLPDLVRREPVRNPNNVGRNDPCPWGSSKKFKHCHGNANRFVRTGVTDLRKGMDGLAALVETALAERPFSGDVFAFRGRRGDRVKRPWRSGDGMNLW